MRQMWLVKFIFTTACIAWVAPALSETWHVTGGADGKEQSTWTIGRSAHQSFKGSGEMTTSEGKKVSLSIVGGTHNLLVVDSPHTTHMCNYHISELSTYSVSGTAYCGNVRKFPWKATIDDPADTSVPVLLKAHEDPRQTSAYATTSEGDRAKFKDAADQFLLDIRHSPLMAIRDIQCMADQYLYVQMQKPHWTDQDVRALIQSSCVVPELVYKQRMEYCAKAYGPSGPFKDVMMKNSDFCSCYATNYTKEFVANVNNANQGQSDLGVKSYEHCRANR